MAGIRLDLSPMLVNRTAAFTLCTDLRDIAVAMDGNEVSFQLFGQRMPRLPDHAARRALTQDFFDKLGSGHLHATAEDDLDLWAGGAAGGGARTFYVDPLYVLMAPLRPDDTVLLLDLSPVTYPHWHKPAVSAAYADALRKIIRVGPRLAAISQNTIDTFHANFGPYGKPIRYLPLYPPAFIRQAAASDVRPLPTPWPYLLFVGSLEARKNMLAAIRAFALSGLAREGYRLMIIGGRGHGAEEIQRAALTTEGVVIAGYLSADEVSAAYKGAQGFVYPSYLEGFGVPLLEAMSFGVPCIASTTGACPEVGGADVIYVDPDDHVALARDMRRLVQLSPLARRVLGDRLALRARHVFSFEAFANRVREVLAA